jgi:hypothetical protein
MTYKTGGGAATPPPEATISQQPQARSGLSACRLSLDYLACPVGSRDIASGRTQQKTPFPTVLLLREQLLPR